MKLSNTALIVLGNAAQRDDRLVPRRPKAPPVVDVNACRALVKQGLLEIVRMPPGASDLVTVREDDESMAFVIADAGYRAINLEPPGADSETTATDGPTAPDTAAEVPVASVVPEATCAAPAAPSVGSPVRSKTTLRDAAQAILDTWDDEGHRAGDLIAALEPPMASLRTLLAGAVRSAPATGPRKPREGTKQEAVLTMLRRTEGATIAHIMEATGWQQHTVRGFFAGLKKKGIDVTVLERVRQVGPNKEGAKGSYSIYCVATPVAG